MPRLYLLELGLLRAFDEVDLSYKIQRCCPSPSSKYLGLIVRGFLIDNRSTLTIFHINQQFQKVTLLKQWPPDQKL